MIAALLFLTTANFWTYGNYYAAQTYSDAPDGRCIQIGWAQGVTFGMEFRY